MNNKQQYQWIDAHAIYPDQGEKSYALKRLRYQLRSWLHRHTIKQFEQFINQSADLPLLLNSRKNYGYPLVHRFLDKRFNTKQRYQAICDNLQFLPQKLAHLATPLWQQPLNFGEIIEGFEIYLNINEHQPMEGYWALELREKASQRLIYLLTFGKLDDALLIAVVQGSNEADAKDIVKHLTKACFGLRPAYLLVEVMKMLTQILGYTKLLGIPQQYQNKSRLVQSRRYLVDYDSIFGESGGTLAKYWQLPLQSSRDLDAVASKKRSMYRKRFAMLDNFKEKMQNALH